MSENQIDKWFRDFEQYPRGNDAAHNTATHTKDFEFVSRLKIFKKIYMTSNVKLLERVYLMQAYIFFCSQSIMDKANWDQKNLSHQVTEMPTTHPPVTAFPSITQPP